MRSDPVPPVFQGDQLERGKGKHPQITLQARLWGDGWRGYVTPISCLSMYLEYISSPGVLVSCSFYICWQNRERENNGFFLNKQSYTWFISYEVTLPWLSAPLTSLTHSLFCMFPCAYIYFKQALSRSCIQNSYDSVSCYSFMGNCRWRRTYSENMFIFEFKYQNK